MSIQTHSPRLFIGSSTEGRAYADAVFAELETACEPSVWDQDLFRPTRATIEGLDKFTKEFEYAVFILTPDDVLASRGATSPAPRDNLIFELGLFIGALGRDRVWFISPEQHSITLPSDLLGVTRLFYRLRQDQNHRAAVRTACTAIRTLIETSTFRQDTQGRDVLFWHTIPDRHRDSSDARNLIARSVRRVLVSGITLSYIAQHCRRELKEALARGVVVELVIAEHNEVSLARYNRCSPVLEENLPLAHKKHRLLWEDCSLSGLAGFAVFATRAPMMHSIGLYDDSLYVSEFCIDTESSRVPSFCVPSRTPSYDIFLGEIRVLLSESDPLFTSTPSKILATL